MLRHVLTAAALLTCSTLCAAEEQPLRVASRGELLYSTHCIACHNEQVHWREKRIVKDTASLRSEVWRWQQLLNLRWDRQDIEEVSTYLQATYYPLITAQ